MEKTLHFKVESGTTQLRIGSKGTVVDFLKEPLDMVVTFKRSEGETFTFKAREGIYDDNQRFTSSFNINIPPNITNVSLICDSGANGFDIDLLDIDQIKETYRQPLTVKATELIEMQKGFVKIQMNGMLLEGKIGRINLSALDSSLFGDFEFIPSELTKSKYPNVEIQTNLTAFEIQGIRSK